VRVRLECSRGEGRGGGEQKQRQVERQVEMDDVARQRRGCQGREGRADGVRLE